jgi:hypothetical protein
MSEPSFTEAVYDDPDDASSGFSSVKLYWDQKQVWVQQEIETSVKGALQAIGTVGGIFSFVDGIFALIFGRAILALVTGKSAPLILPGFHSRCLLTNLPRRPSHLSIWHDGPLGSPQVQEANS